MTLKHPDAAVAASDDLSIAPIFNRESHTLPRHELPEGELPPDVAYQIVHDELMLDGNARLNLATFVTTWMEPQAERLMAECFDKNMIDKDEYPQTAELETRCVNILSRLWNAPDAHEAIGCSTTGSSEAAMLGGLALKRRWQQRRKAEGKPADKPNLVMGINVQVCWEKFANYWDVEMRLVPMEGDRLNLSAEEAVKLLRREHDRRRRDPRLDLRRLVRAGRGDLRRARRLPGARPASTFPVHVDGASGAFVAPVRRPRPRLGLPAAARRLDQRLGPQVRPRLSRRRLDRLARQRKALPEDLIFWVNYLGDNMPTFALNFSRPGAQVVAQYYNFLRLGFDGYRKVHGYSRDVATRLSARIAELGPFELLTHGDELPVFAFTLRGRHRQLHASSTSRTRCASAAGSSRRTRSRRTGGPRRAAGRREAAGSRTTWPTCSSTT